MNIKINSLLGITIFLVLFSFQSQAFGENEAQKVFPEWVKQSTSIWINGQISDAEFLALIQNVLDNDILLDEILIDKAKDVINDIPTLHEQKTAELIPYWVKDRAEWWIEGKITDLQFLRTIHYLREVGYLEYDPEKSLFLNNETFQSSLEKL
jgi:uncharacterized protein YfaQ (DUF2300 family)